MKKNILLIFLFLFCISCLGMPIPCDSVYRSDSLSSKTKTFLCGDGGRIKYRCDSTKNCCEVGKNCEEDLTKEDKKNEISSKKDD
jgi:hypothetical protein